MKVIFGFLGLLRWYGSRRAFQCGIVLLALASIATAKPITYIGFTIADGKLGNWSFHNARVYLVMQGDTSAVQSFEAPNPGDPTDPVDVLMNPTGTSSVTVISGSRVVHATFDPNQIFVSMDVGLKVDRPHVGGRGVGFGTYTATGIQPVYPFGIQDGTVDWGDIPGDQGTASAGLQGLPISLSTDTVFTGRAYACWDFFASGDVGTCPSAPALHTDKGDFYISLPHVRYYQPPQTQIPPPISDALDGGSFVSILGEEPRVAPPLPSSPVHHAAKAIAYHGYTIADVTLGEHHFPGAQVYVSVDADAADAVPFTNGTSHGFMNSEGNAHVTIVAHGRSISADFDPGQIYVYFDAGTASVGFGSTASGSGYPLSITGTSDGDSDGLIENNSIAAVVDIMTTPGDVQFYSPATAALVTDLTNATVFSGGASSCVDFNPVTSICQDLDKGVKPTSLKTNRGDFLISQPYTADHGSGPYSVSWGIFWSELQPRGDD
jgi:hypothetical protein